MPEQTLLIVKPDAVRRGLVGEILGRVEAKGGACGGAGAGWPTAAASVAAWL